MLFPRSQSLPLSIIIADPTGGGRALETLRGLRDGRLGLPCEAIAVIGGPDCPATRTLRQEFPLVSLYRCAEAHDLGALFDVGLNAAAGKLLLLLDGTVRVGGAAIAELMAFMEQGPWIAMVAPRLLAPNGEEVAPSRLFPTVGSALADFGSGAASRHPGPRLQNALDRRVTTPKEVDAVTVGCVLVKRQALEQVGGFTVGYPPGGEMLDWCRRARQGGWSIFYHPGQAGHMLADDREDPRQAAVQLAAACRFIRRHRGLVELVALELLVTVQIARGIAWGSAALIPGTHRAGARTSFWRAWYALGALVDPRRAGVPRTA